MACSFIGYTNRVTWSPLRCQCFGFFFEWPDIGRARRCGACRLPGHGLRRCPLVKAPDVRCTCKKDTCAKCSVACETCGVKGHTPDTLEEPVRGGVPARFTCDKLNEAAMQGRVLARLAHMSPTARDRRERARASKEQLAQLTPRAGSRLSTVLQQAAVVDRDGLGGAGASPAVRTAESVAAALEDDGASRAASRTLSAFVAVSAAAGGRGATQPPPGLIASIDLAGSRQTAVSAMEEAMRKRPRYSSSDRNAMRRVVREAGLRAAGTATPAEVLRSSNPHFRVTGAQLKQAAVRYVQLPDGDVLSKVRQALSLFVGGDMLFNGCSVTSSVWTTEQVCGELMGCADRVGLTAPSVRASLRQFLKEMREGDEGLLSFFPAPESADRAN